MDIHHRHVARIAASVKSFYERGEPFRICHGSTNSTRNQSFREKAAMVDVSALCNVLQVDVDARLAIVEPNVAMDRLVEETLNHGLVPQVVMDFVGITVGGGYSGTSGESSSFRHGFFDQTVDFVDIVLGNGDVVRCSRTERADLFHGAAGALGTLGVVTMLAVRLDEASRYVRLTYHPVSTSRDAVDMINAFVANGQDQIDYIDGILFSEISGAIITGKRTNKADAGLPVRTFSRAKDPWFYLHVSKAIAGRSEPVSEMIPLAEYFFRYDRGTFWMGKTIFDYFHGLLPFNRMTRRLLDDFMHTRMLYAAMHSQPLNVATIQDIAVPMHKAPSFLEWCAREVGIWPLWLCPLKQSSGPTMHPHDGVGTDQMLNIGIWGIVPANDLLDHWEKHNKSIELKLREIGAMKWLYGANMQIEEEFWSQFDRKWYDALRQKYHASTLPNVFQKVHVDPEQAKQKLLNASNLEVLTWMWPLGMGKALLRAWRTGAYKPARVSTWHRK